MKKIIAAFGAAVFALSASALDGGYRYRDGKCINDAGEEGLNPGFFGPCGDFRNTMLGGLDLSELDLSGADFSGSDLKDLKFDSSDLTGTNFSSCKLLRISGRSATLKLSQFSNSIVSKSDFSGANFSRSKLTSASLGQSKFMGSDMGLSDLSQADIRGSDFTAARLETAVLQATIFDDKTILPFAKEQALALGMRFINAILIDFETVAPHPNRNDVVVGDFYAGGKNKAGENGPELGVTFSANAMVLCMNTVGTDCSAASRGGMAEQSAKGGLYSESDDPIILDSAEGFVSEFSVSVSNQYDPVTIEIFDGPHGSGELLARIDVPRSARNSCDAKYSATYCPLTEVRAQFSGTAHSVVLPSLGGFMVYDDIYLGEH